MFEILKHTKVHKGVKIAIGIWLLLLALVVIIFATLCFMSKDRINHATMIVEKRISPTLDKCKTTCSEIGFMESKTRESVIQCQKKCENKNLNTYRIKLDFDDKIFRAQRFYANITLNSIEFNKDIERLGKVDSIYQIAKDSDFLEIKVPYLLQAGQNIGTISYTTTFLNTMLNDYAIRLIAIMALCVMIWFCFNPLRKFMYLFDSTHKRLSYTANAPLPPLTSKDRIFLAFITLCIISLCIFQFWLGFPGYYMIADNYSNILLGTRNFAPVFPSYILGILYFLFGKHLYYLFLFNLVPFYAGLLFIVSGFYIRFRSIAAIFLLFPIFIGNIFFQNFLQLTSFALPMLLFCGYAMVLFILLVPLSGVRAKVMWWAIGIVFFFAILWRHNAILSVFPVGFILIYMWLCNRGFSTKEFIAKYIKWLFGFAILCLCVITIVPRNLIFPRPALPANHVFLHQIAGACVPANDSSCFKEEWYYPNKNFEDVKELYKIHPLFADPFGTSWRPERPFPHAEINGLYSQWIKSIAKYPINFMKHELRFLESMWFQEPSWIFDSNKLQEKPTKSSIEIVSKFPESEYSVTLTSTKLKIYDFLYKHRLLLNHIYGVLASLFVMMAAIVLWICKNQMRNTLLAFCFSSGFAGFFSAVFIALFTPLNEPRYMSPILPLGIIALIGFIAFICDYYKNRDSNAIA